MAPTISVLITNFNYARFLPQAIDSVLAQTVPPHQVVVVDDGSTDDSLAVLRKRYSSTVEVLAKPNGGQGSAFNAGFARCEGDVICLLDADDTGVPASWPPWPPRSVARRMQSWCGTTSSSRSWTARRTASACWDCVPRSTDPWPARAR